LLVSLENAVTNSHAPLSLTFALHLRSAKLAAVTSERVVYLFDDNGEKKDKFRTKPADQGSNPNFVVRAMAFSPDSTRLAIAQSDNIVFVYRWVFKPDMHSCLRHKSGLRARHALLVLAQLCVHL
jgi:intraflagellar transport protein 172